MENILYTLFSVPFFLIGLFIFWKKLREDYVTSQIFGFGFLVYFAFILAVALVGMVSFEFRKWLLLIFPVTAGVVYGVKYKMRFNEIFNSASTWVYLASIYYYLLMLFKHNNFFNLISVTISILAIGLFYFLETKYKNIVWYKSGKIGFSGSIILVLFFLVNFIGGITNSNLVFFSGRINAIISLGVVLAIGTYLFRLSRKVTW